VTRGPGTCWINDEPAPYCCSQPIRWLPLSVKCDFFNSLSESNPLPESFPPLEMYISFSWTDEAYVTLPHCATLTDAILSPQSVPNAPTMTHAEISRNSFSVPEYDDDDDEIEIIHESVRTPRVEVVVPSRRYTVPESDLSCAGSFTSEDSSSEPPTPSPRNSRTDIASWKQLSEKIKENSPEDVSSPAMARERLIALSDAPSAAGFFHSSSEQAPAYHQGPSQPKPAVERETVPSMADSHHAAEDAMDDEDLTESDIEFADGSSDDLFDDDGESAQQDLIAESLPPSEFDDSDEEPQSSNRGMKLVDSTTYTQVLRPCGMDAEDHSNVPTTDREPVESSDFRSPLFDAIYSPNPASVKQNLVPKTSNSMNDARAPSPSDAAMAKTTTAQLPHLETPVQVQAPFLVPMTSDFPRLSTTEAPYARSTWSAWPSYPADLPSEYAPPLYPPFNSNFLYQEGPFGYRQPADYMNADDSSDRGEEETSTYQTGTFKKPDQPVNSTRGPIFTIATAPEVDQDAHVLATAGLRATRLSIDDIVEKNTQEASGQSSGQKLKRKVDDMSTDEDNLATVLAPRDPQVVSELGLAPQAAESAQSATPQTVTPLTTDAELVAQTPTTEAGEQSAPKRVKTGVAKYAAAVFAGVVAGGVGTMAALLALPPIQLS
jgi:hypothetical protein